MPSTHADQSSVYERLLESVDHLTRVILEVEPTRILNEHILIVPAALCLNTGWLSRSKAVTNLLSGATQGKAELGLRVWTQWVALIMANSTDIVYAAFASTGECSK